jgi:hypothetical protein
MTHPWRHCQAHCATSPRSLVPVAAGQEHDHGAAPLTEARAGSTSSRAR